MRAAWCRASEDKPMTYMDAELHRIRVKKKQACNLSPLKRDGFEKMEILWWSMGMLCDIQPLKHPPNTHTHCSILHASRSVPCGRPPTVSYKLPFLFKHHLRLLCLSSHTPRPPPLAPATSNPSTVSHHILVNMIRRKIISNHPDLSLIQVLSRMAGRRGGGWWVANGVKVFGYAGWMHEDNTPAPLPPLSHSVSYIKLIVRLVWLWDM